MYLYLRGWHHLCRDTSKRHSNLRNFINSWKMLKNATKHRGKFFLHKINKNMQRNRGVMLCILAGIKEMASLTSNSKLCNFIKNDQTPKNFVEASFSVKLTKIWEKRVKFWPHVPFNKFTMLHPKRINYIVSF